MDAKPRGVVSEDIQHRIDKIDHIIEQYVVKLPSLASVETNIKVRKKQFYYIILYYMINKQWPHIKSKHHLRFVFALFPFIQLLIDNEILKAFNEISNKAH